MDDDSCVRPEKFIHIYVNQTEFLLDFLEFIVKVDDAFYLWTNVLNNS